MTQSQQSPSAEERLEWLASRVAASGGVTIAEAAGELGVSEMTIRRDLVELEERGMARRVRGGARSIGPQTFAQRRDRRARAKARVAAKLTQMIPETGAIAFDASSTVMRVVPTLDSARDLVVITNGPDTFTALQGRPGITPLLTGGQLDPRTGSLVGPLACRAQGQVAVSHFFTSAASVNLRVGAAEATLEEAEVKRAAAATARQIVLAVDSSKLDAEAFAVSVDWDAIDVLVTELDPSDERLRPYRSRCDVR